MSCSNWAFIFARGGSKGLPRKNIRPLAGIPLIAWSIRCAQDCQLFDRVIVSTDDDEIADVARRYGADVPFVRPGELALDSSSEWSAWRHAVASVPKFSRFVSLPATAPLRSCEDVIAAVRRHEEGIWDAVLAVTPSHRNPSFNMVTLGDRGAASILMPPKTEISRRQDAAPTYDITTVTYVTTPEYIRRASNFFDGRVGAIVVPKERAVDIDDEVDFAIAEALLRRKAEQT